MRKVLGLILIVSAFFACGRGVTDKRSARVSFKEGFNLADDKALSVRMEWLNGPHPDVDEGHPNKIRLTFLEKGKQVKVTDVKAWPFMDVHGHAGYPEKHSKVTQIGDHVYDISDFYFTMPGKWAFKVWAKAEGGRLFATSIDFDVAE